MKSGTWQKSFSLLILLFLFVLPGFMHSPRYLSLFDEGFLNIVLALSMYSMWTLGYVNAATPTFFGLGAYSVSILMMKASLPFWLAFPMASFL